MIDEGFFQELWSKEKKVEELGFMGQNQGWGGRGGF